jgi:hypothetical protein
MSFHTDLTRATQLHMRMQIQYVHGVHGFSDVLYILDIVEELRVHRRLRRYRIRTGDCRIKVSTVGTYGQALELQGDATNTPLDVDSAAIA